MGSYVCVGVRRDTVASARDSHRRDTYYHNMEPVHPGLPPEKPGGQDRRKAWQSSNVQHSVHETKENAIL